MQKPKHMSSKLAQAKEIFDSQRAESTPAPYSFTQQVAELEIGEACSKLMQVEAGVTLADVTENLTEWKTSLRNNMASAVTGAKKRTGGQYAVEVTQVITIAGTFYLLAIITRTA